MFCGFEWNKYCPVVSVWSFFCTCWNIWALTKSRTGILSYFLISDSKSLSKHFRLSHHFISHDCFHGYRCLKFCRCILLRTLTRNVFFFIITCRFWVSDLVPTSLRINTSLSLSQNCLTKPPLGTYMEVKGEQNDQSWQTLFRDWTCFSFSCRQRDPGRDYVRIWQCVNVLYIVT